jgi:hypothetical protein
LANVPTSLSPDLVTATTEGVRRFASAFSITLGLEPSIIAATELVVPKSIPIILLFVCVIVVNLTVYY